VVPARSSVHGLSCSRRSSPLSGRNSTYRTVQISGTGSLFEFLLNKFVEQQKFGLTKAKLARRIGKTPDVINRWLNMPSNLTADTISDLLLGICAEEPEMGGKSLLNRVPVNYGHLDEYLPQLNRTQPLVSGASAMAPLSNATPAAPFDIGNFLSRAHTP
jgi:hypothetical protein